MINYINVQWLCAADYFSKNLRRLFFIYLLLFVALAVLTVALFQSNPDIANTYYQEISKMFAEKNMLDKSGFGLFLSIFVNNIWAGAVVILLGFIPFLFIPNFSFISNVMIIGVMGAVFQINGIGLLPFFAGILPHGVLEIPALILGTILGIHICQKITKVILRRGSPGEFKQAFFAALRIFLLWMVPLFAIASGIETFVTPIIFTALL